MSYVLCITELMMTILASYLTVMFLWFQTVAEWSFTIVTKTGTQKWLTPCDMASGKNAVREKKKTTRKNENVVKAVWEHWGGGAWPATHGSAGARHKHCYGIKVTTRK